MRAYRTNLAQAARQQRRPTNAEPRSERGPQQRRPVDAPSRIREWLEAWIHVHVVVFMFFFTAMERFNNFVLRVAMPSTDSVHQAVIRGELRTVERLARRGEACLVSRDEQGRSALHVALDQLEAAVADEGEDDEEGAVAAVDNAGAAADTGAGAIGPGPSCAGPSSAVPSSAERRAIVQCLLRHQADVRMRDAHERTPLHVAVQASFHDVASILIDAGADVTARCKGASTLRQATLRRDAQMIQLLLEASREPEYINSVGRDGWSALGLAARAGDTAVVRALLAAGADRTANCPAGTSKSALDIARLNGKTAVVKLLQES